MKRIQLESVLIVSLMLFAGACATSQPKEGEGMDSVPTADAGTDAVPQPTAETPQPPAEAPHPTQQDAAQASAPSAPVAAAPQSETPAADSGSESYTVQEGDTLMKIAFETMGDLYRWREIYELNKGQISDPNKISKGMVLKLSKSGASSVEKNGEKYLIKEGDTLGTISTAVYGTKSRWKELWENNKQLIHDPNRIFAGFYLYYMNGSSNRVMGSTDTSTVPDAKAVEIPNKVSPSEPNPAPALTPSMSAPSAAEAPSAQPAAPADPNAPPTL